MFVDGSERKTAMEEEREMDLNEKEREIGFSEEQERLVKESWEIMKEDIPALSLHFFTQVLEIAPAAKGLFSFLKDEEEIPQDNPKLKAHAVKVFKMTCEAAIQLREKGEIVVSGSTLKWLGSVHLQKGVIDPHFELLYVSFEYKKKMNGRVSMAEPATEQKVVKEALIRTVEKGVGEKWSEEMKGAWSEAYDQLAAAIKAEMKQEVAEETNTTV